MTIYPLRGRVLLKRTELESTSAGGIVLTGNAAEKSTRAEVIAVGPGHRLDNGDICPLAVSVGDRVIFDEGFDAKTVKVDGQELLLVSEDKILAKVEE